MSLHYLIDPFTPAQSIIDVTLADSGSSDSTGGLLIRVPDGVSIQGSPSDLTGLQSAKSDGLLAYYAGFTNIAFDDCLTGNEVSSEESAGYVRGGGLVNHCLFDGGQLVTDSIAASGAPSQCLVVWEAYSFSNEDPISGRFSRIYVEEDSDLLTCEIAFDGLGVNPATNGDVVNVSPGNLGPGPTHSFKLTFTNTIGRRLYLGSWSVIY